MNRFALLVLFVLALWPASQARAVWYPTPGEAHAQCIADASAAASWAATAPGGWHVQNGGCTLNGQTSTYIVWNCAVRSGSDAVRSCRAPLPSDADFEYGADTAQLCPAGQTWNGATMLCDCDGGFEKDPEAPGQCLTPARCTARNSTLATGPTTRNFSSDCVGGCQLRAEESANGMVAVDGLFTGTYRYTGNSCATPTTPVQTPEQAKEQPAEKCKQSGSFKLCVKPNGDQCLSGSNGRQVCWRPGETGEKTDGPVLQKRNAGDTERPPSLELPNGDTLQKQGESLTQTTTITKNSTTSTITTTTTNYTTTNGTNAGTKDSGQPADTGNPSSSPDGDGDEEGDKNGVGGDGTCASGWAPSGDPVLGGILTESWKQRCNDEKVQSDMRADAQTLADSTQPDGDPESVWAGDDSGAINEGWLVLGAGSCPVISVNIPGVGPWSPPPAFCSVIAALAALFQLAAYLWALRIVSS